MKTYIYKGEQEVTLPGIGTVRPQETITTDKKINNALFEEQEKPINRSKTK